MEKLAELAPCGTVKVAGTGAAEAFELATDTVKPPLPAAAVKLTVAVVD